MLRKWWKRFDINSLFVFWEAIKLLTMGALVLRPLVPELSGDHAKHSMEKCSYLNLTWQRMSNSPTLSTRLKGAVLLIKHTLI